MTQPEKQFTRPRTAVLARIRGMLPSLSAAESAVGHLVLEDPTGALHRNVATLADDARVSTATVHRFCQTLGFTGLKEFKLALSADVSTNSTVLLEDVEPGDSLRDIITKVLYSDIEAIRQTLELLDLQAFGAAVEALSRSESVQIYGIGSSAPIAVDAYYRFLRIGLPVAVVSDSHMQAVSASVLNSRCAALVISHTGRTTETLDAARLAKEQHAIVIGLSSFSRTPLSEIADIELVTATGETAFRMEAMASRIAHLSVIDALYVALAARNHDGALKTLSRTGEVIEGKRLSGTPRRSHD